MSIDGITRDGECIILYDKYWLSQRKVETEEMLKGSDENDGGDGYLGCKKRYLCFANINDHKVTVDFDNNSGNPF